jgi:hypothetical protein
MASPKAESSAKPTHPWPSAPANSKSTAAQIDAFATAARMTAASSVTERR